MKSLKSNGALNLSGALLHPSIQKPECAWSSKEHSNVNAKSYEDFEALSDKLRIWLIWWIDNIRVRLLRVTERRKMDAREFMILFGSTEMCLAADSSINDPMPIDNPIAGATFDMPWTSIFLVICTAMFAALSGQPTVQEWAVPFHSSLWQKMNRRIGALSPSQEKLWIKHCRMKYPAFVYLVEELRPFIAQSTQTVRDPVEVELAVAMVLNRLATGLLPSAVGEIWGVGASTVVKYTKLITSILANKNKLYSKYVLIPTTERQQRITSNFMELTGIPNMCGAIDGTHIVLQKKPEQVHGPAVYRTVSGDQSHYSILLQGVCDGDKIFWDVCCNAAGGLDDGAHFKASSLWTKLRNKEVLSQPTINVQGKAVQPYLVGDENYPLSPFLIKPLNKVQAIDSPENSFDLQIQKGHASICTAFGLLKSRWRILRHLDVDLKFAAQTVLACCVLHNFCQISGQKEPVAQVDLNPNNNFSISSTDIDREVEIAGNDIRHALFLDWFYHHQNSF